MIGSVDNCDLPCAIHESRFFRNLVRRSASGEASRHSFEELQEFLTDHRGSARMSFSQVMAYIAAIYSTAVVFLLPRQTTILPDLPHAFTVISAAGVILGIQLTWLVLFIYYGRSRVTGSTLTFHVIVDQV